MKHIKYLKYLLRHKFWVFVYTCRMGIPWRGFMHDMSKFLPSEWIPYTNYFYGARESDIKRGRDETGYYKPQDTGDRTFDFAWFLHQKRNRHHWQYWLLPCDDGTEKVIEIPLAYRKEMLCDWRGAGKAQGTPNTIAWYEKNKNKMRLGEETRKWIEENLYPQSSIKETG